MQPMKVVLIAATAVTSACASYVLPQPSGFAPGQTLAVQGGTGFKLNQMTVGDYSVQIDRGSTKEKQEGELVRERAKSQGYSFVVKQNETTVFTGGCSMQSEARRIAGPAGFEIHASESSEIECEMLPKGMGSNSWRLVLTGKPENPMKGSFTGNGEYVVEGVGTAFGSTKHGPTGGYYIKQGDRTVASVQVVGKRHVLFAPEARSEPLLAAAIALLLIDDTARRVD